MTCPAVRERDPAEQYVAGALPSAERDAFEAHLFDCDACFAQVELLNDVRHELAGATPDAVARRTRRWLLPLAAAAALLLAATGSFIAWRPRAAPPALPAARSAPAEQLAAPGGTTASREALLALAAVAPPPYVALHLRGEAQPDFDRGMAAYARGDYAAAETALGRAVRRGTAPAAASFFLGVSQLMTGDAPAAAEHLRVASRGKSAYTAAALVFLAKALIRTGDVNGAEREADRAAMLRGEYANQGRALAAALRSVR